MLWPLQVKDDETVTVGQVLAKIAAGEAPSQPAGEEDASAGAAPAEATALDAESKPDSGIPVTGPCTPALRCIRPTVYWSSRLECTSALMHEDGANVRTWHTASGAAAEAAKEPVSQAEADSAAESAPAPEPQHRQPGIRFPQRRTPRGERITMLPAKEQLQ